jgi:ectoine hydroxylase-related dioxygenase (phytanoyl-CoA dioxygenase family)
MLDDFKEDNGATRVVPGTHLKKAPQFCIEDRIADHPEQVLVTGKAGTVVVMNSHLWHGGTNNITGESRKVLHPYYVAREFKQQQDQRKYITKETYERISPAARYLLDVEGAF